MSHIQRQNAKTFARCQANYDAMLPPEDPDPWPCAICGEDTHDENERENVAPICDDCVEEWYLCSVCGDEWAKKAEKKNDACDNCKEENDED